MVNTTCFKSTLTLKFKVSLNLRFTISEFKFENRANHFAQTLKLLVYLVEKKANLLYKETL